MGRRRNKTPSSSNPAAVLGLKSDLISCDVSPVYGRFLRAKVDIKKGAVLLKEDFLVAGPKINSAAFCVGCHSELSEGRKSTPCKCKWPLCTNLCGSASPFHTSWECGFLLEHRIEPPANPLSTTHGCLTVLRCLALKLQKSSTSWEKLNHLQSHSESRRQIPSAREEVEGCKSTIRGEWGLRELFSDEEVENACGIFEVNSFEMGDCYSFGGIFPSSSMCAHDCVPNCSQNELADERSLEIRAIVDIPTGEAIKLCYDSCLKGTLPRQLQLQSTKHFLCACARCTDPTELGTHFSTLICASCKKGFVTRDSEWKCARCQHVFEDSQVDTVVRKYSAMASVMGDIQSKEKFLLQCKPVFHPNHFVPFGLKYSLCMAYGREDGRIEELSNGAAHRKLELCQEVMKVLNVLTPGLSISRANILYEQQAAEVLIAKNLYDGGRCSKNLIKGRVKNAIGLLEEAIQIFEMNYATKVLAEAARDTTLKELEGWLGAMK